jgi:hypothetical protein
MKKLAVFLLTIYGSINANVANAASPVGLWEVAQYDFATKAYINIVKVCFLSNGTLKHYSNYPSFIDWNGQWKQNGDLVLMRMNNINGVGVGENTLTIYSPNTMTGYGQSWSITNTATGYYTSSVWTFKGTCI